MSDGSNRSISDPYLSLVVTARNDDHGGNLLGRMQIFVDGWIEQARRCGIRSELIVVEWNPPPDRPRLVEALRWPREFGPCVVRFIEVPPEIHSRYPHSAALPLYQMIGKNVGIRRARGEFVLATNIDILFSNELADFLAKQILKADSMYRVDRYDAMSAVPPGAPLEKQLDYCRTHLIRINRREGTFPTDADGTPNLNKSDVAPAELGVQFGRGWFPLEWSAGVPFLWGRERAEILLGPPQKPISAVILEIEPGPATGGAPLDLEVSIDNQPIGRVAIDSRSELRVPLTAPVPAGLLLRSMGRTVPAGNDPRALCLRVFRIRYDLKDASPAQSKPDTLRVKRVRSLRRMAAWWAALQHLIHKLATGGPLVELTVPVSPRLRRLLRTYVEAQGLTGMLRRSLRRQAPPTIERTPAAEFRGQNTYNAPAFLHTNACGDFTLLARERWFDLRGYAEFDVYSMNLDSVLCYTAHYAGAREEVLAEPMRIYHIEHGSGWTPEGYAELFSRLAANGISFVPNDEVLGWASQMNRLHSPMIFNHENWGLSDFTLNETVLPSPEA